MLVDTHCHLDFADFEAERDEIVARAHAAGVAQMVTISTRVRKLDGLLAITEKYPSVFCSVGTHPNNAADELDIQTEDLVRLANEHRKVVAIGEAGLDYFYDTQKPEDQQAGFRRHIAAARETQLPLVIHSRSADADIEGHVPAIDLGSGFCRHDGDPVRAFFARRHRRSSVSRKAERSRGEKAAL